MHARCHFDFIITCAYWRQLKAYATDIQCHVCSFRLRQLMILPYCMCVKINKGIHLDENRILNSKLTILKFHEQTYHMYSKCYELQVWSFSKACFTWYINGNYLVFSNAASSDLQAAMGQTWQWRPLWSSDEEACSGSGHIKTGIRKQKIKDHHLMLNMKLKACIHEKFWK